MQIRTFKIIILLFISSVCFGKTYQTKKHHRKHHHGTHLSSKKERRHRLVLGAVPILDSMDFRPSLTPIQDQHQCGSCWAFSLTATLRDHVKPDPGGLSQQYLVDCARNSNGCEGGTLESAMYLVGSRGAPSSSLYPYVAANGKCKHVAPVARGRSYHVMGDPSQKDIVEYMSQAKSPVSSVMAAGAGDFESYTKGIYDGCVNAQPDHAINIVGYDLEGAAFDENGNLPPGIGYWIARNSWGPQWGEEGYFRIRMTDHQGNRCNGFGTEIAYIDVN